MKKLIKPRQRKQRKPLQPRVRIHAYKTASKAAKALAEVLNVKQIATNTKFKPRVGDLLINLGSSELRVPQRDGVTIVNHPSAVALAANKVLFFRALKGHDNIQTVPATEDRAEAQEWLEEGSTVYCRTLTRSHSGNGIHVSVGDDKPLVPAPLYTKGITGGRREIRLHVFNGKVTLIQQKRRRDGWQENENYKDEIRNHGSDWVYSHLNVTPPPEQAEQMAIDTVMALGLDFASVDMITRRGECYVLEVNTCSGLEGNTLELYANKFREVIREKGFEGF